MKTSAKRKRHHAKCKWKPVRRKSGTTRNEPHNTKQDKAARLSEGEESVREKCCPRAKIFNFNLRDVLSQLGSPTSAISIHYSCWGLIWASQGSKLIQWCGCGQRRGTGRFAAICRWYNFFCKPAYSNVMAIKAILRYFKLVFGLRINFHMSQVGSVGVPPTW